MPGWNHYRWERPSGEVRAHGGRSPAAVPEGGGMPTSAKVMAICTGVCLIAVCAYTVAFGSNGWLWFAWVVLATATAGVTAAHRGR